MNQDEWLLWLYSVCEAAFAGRSTDEDLEDWFDDIVTYFDLMGWDW